MFKFGQKKNNIQEEQEQQLLIENALKNRDSWIKNYFIVVPNSITPKDLKKYQKLIVLRKPEGEQRVVVDFSLTDSETERMHFESLNNDMIDINTKDVLRIIPTNLDTKELHKDTIIKDEDIDEIYKILTESTDEFRKMEDNSDELNNTLLRMSDDKVKIINDNFFNASALNQDKDVDDIDSVVINTDEQKQLRETWSDVDDFISHEDEVEKRVNGIDTYNGDFPKDYCPEIQPLFRNFIETDFFDLNKYEEKTYESFDEKSINEYPNYDANINMDVNQNDEMSEEYNENVEIYSFDDDDEIHQEHENPEILVSNYEDNTTKMSDYLANNQVKFDAQDVEQDQPNTVVSFFKNNVTPTPIQPTGMGHIPKHIKFYKTTRDVKYEKVILNKKKKMYTYRKMLVNK